MEHPIAARRLDQVSNNKKEKKKHLSSSGLCSSNRAYSENEKKMKN